MPLLLHPWLLGACHPLPAELQQTRCLCTPLLTERCSLLLRLQGTAAATPAGAAGSGGGDSGAAPAAAARPHRAAPQAACIARCRAEVSTMPGKAWVCCRQEGFGQGDWTRAPGLAAA